MRQIAHYILLAPWLLFFNAAGAQPQEQVDRSRNPTEKALLLSQPKHVSLLVIGDGGMPLSQVHVEHANLKEELATGPNGMVEFNTSAPYFVLSRPGYESVRLETGEAAGYRTVLHKLPGGDQFRICTDAELSARAPGWNGTLQISKSGAMKATAEKLDVDYFHRVVSAGSGSKLLWVEQGRGPMWGGADASDSDVWKATRYREVTYMLGDFPVIDTKEWMPDGKCKRSLGIFGESMLYYNLHCQAVQPLDDLMDEACAIPDALKR